MKTFRFLAPVLMAVLVLVLALAVLPAAQPAQAGPLLARTVITPTAVTTSGVTQTLTAASSDGNNFSNNGATWVVITNDYTDVITATFQTPRTIDGLDVADKAIAVPTSTTFIVGPFGSLTYNQDDGTVYVDFSEVTSVTLGEFYLR